MKLKNSVLYKQPTPSDLRLAGRVKPILNRARFGHLPVALNFLAKHLQLPKLCATNALTLINRLRWLLFYQRQLSLPIQTLMA